MDETIMSAVNGLVGKSDLFDDAVVLYSQNAFTKGVPIALIFLYLWFRPVPAQAIRRIDLLAALGVAFVAIALGRVLALTLPFRERPIRGDMDLTLPAGMSADALDGWTSFPSDHAVLFFAMAAAFWMIDRRAGALMAAQALFAVAFARVYLTFHWPSDVAAGALVGILSAAFLLRPLSAAVARSGLLEREERYPQWMYPILFAVLFQIVTMFDSARRIIGSFVDLLT